MKNDNEAEGEGEESTAVAKAAPLSMAQQRKENEQYFQDPMAMVRAARGVIAKSQWGTSLTPDEAQAYEGIAQANDVSLTNGTAYVLGGNLYISLQGRLKLAHDSKIFGGFSVDRVMTKPERESYQIKEGESAWITTAIRFLFLANGEAQQILFTDFGRASTTEKNPVAKQYPVEMAMKRARARALKLAFPCGLQSVEECLEAQIISVTAETIPETKKGVEGLKARLALQKAETEPPTETPEIEPDQVPEPVTASLVAEPEEMNESEPSDEEWNNIQADIAAKEKAKADKPKKGGKTK